MSEFVATVIMPVRNEERFLGVALDAVLVQDLPDGALEVLVVDGRSTDRTREIAEERGRGARFPVQVLDNPGRIAATALNIGIDAARADVVVRVDGHAEIPTDYVRRLLEVLETTGADVAGGAVLPIGSPEERSAIACAMRGPLGHGGAGFRSPASGAVRESDTVAFPAYRKTALRRVGAFDEEMVRNQDDDLHLRLRRAGARVVLVSDLVVRYRCRVTVDGMFRQYFGYGFWKVVGWVKRGRLSSWRAAGPALLVAWIVGSGVALVMASVFAGLDDGQIAGSDALAWLVLYALLQLLWFLPLSLIARWTSPREPGVLWLCHRVEHVVIVMHVAYGLGFWWGILRRGRPPERWG